MREEYIIGKHVYGSLYGIDKEKAWDEEFLRELLLKAVEEAGATLLDIRSWRVEGEKGGISAIAIVLESHLALHTWPEYGYATFDAYTCGDKADPWKAWDLILRELKPKYYTVHYTDRSQKPIPYNP